MEVIIENHLATVAKVMKGEEREMQTRGDPRDPLAACNGIVTRLFFLKEVIGASSETGVGAED